MAETKTPKTRIVLRLFVNDDGSVTPRAQNDTNTVVLKYANEQESRLPLAKVFAGGLPQPCVGRAAAAFGIATSAGNAGTTAAHQAETDDPEIVREAVEERLDTFAPSDGSPGEWSTEREAGAPRTSMLLEAAVAFRQAETGKSADEAWVTSTRAKLADKDYVKKLMSSEKFRPHFERIKLAKQQARAAKAEEAAKSADAGAASDLLA